MSMMKRFMALTLIEKLVCGIIASVVAAMLIAALNGGMSADNPRDLCFWRGGVPITDREGNLVRCDFPVNIYSRP